MSKLVGSDGVVEVTEAGDGCRDIRAMPAVGDGYVQTAECRTGYPVDLVREILAVKGARWVCDEIVREERPDTVRSKLERNLLGYLPPDAFAGKRVLDFGCGCGASTMNLARMLPDSTIVGVELEPACLAAARARLSHYRFDNVTLLQSPRGDRLPEEPHDVDFVVLNAVYEHLLPGERLALLPILWARLRAGGVLFVCETPYRYSFFECHTTGLPVVNYLPDAIVHAVAWRLSTRVERGTPWEKLQRDGIRGGTVSEIVRILRRAGARLSTLNPHDRGQGARIETWHTSLDEMASCYRFRVAGRCGPAKGALDKVLRQISARLNVPFVGDLSLAFRKEP